MVQPIVIPRRENPWNRLIGSTFQMVLAQGMRNQMWEKEKEWREKLLGEQRDYEEKMARAAFGREMFVKGYQPLEAQAPGSPGTMRGPYGDFWKVPEPEIKVLPWKDPQGNMRQIMGYRVGAEFKLLPPRAQWQIRRAGPDEEFEPGTVVAIDLTGNERPQVLQDPFDKKNTAQIKNYNLARTQGYPGTFNDWVQQGRAVSAAQSDPRVKDPFNQISIGDVIGEYESYFGVSPKVSGWYRSKVPGVTQPAEDAGQPVEDLEVEETPAEQPVSAQAEGKANLYEVLTKKLRSLGKGPGRYNIGQYVVEWDGQEVTNVGIRRKIQQ